VAVAREETCKTGYSVEIIITKDFRLYNVSPAELIPRLEALRNKAVRVRNELLELYQKLPTNDPRIVTARHIKSVISSSYLNLILVNENLQDPNWWRRQGFDVAIKKGTIQDELDDYMVLLTNAVILYALSLFEAGLRRVVRAINSDACSGGTAGFKVIYDWLFTRLKKEGWSLSAGDPVAFLDLYRYVRNTIHNNGRYYSPSGTNAIVTWQGMTYEFRHTQGQDFIDWNFHLMLLSNLVELNGEVMRADLIRQLPPIP
jgi:hypothetical protein